jgi:hypothetical protein
MEYISGTIQIKVELLIISGISTIFGLGSFFNYINKKKRMEILKLQNNTEHLKNRLKRLEKDTTNRLTLCNHDQLLERMNKLELLVSNIQEDSSSIVSAVGYLDGIITGDEWENVNSE